MSEGTFRPNGFPSYLSFEEGPDYGAPNSLAGRKMDTNASIFNSTFNRAVGGWGLPPPEIEDGTDGDVGQSEAEIVQKIYLKARGPCHQFEFFFTREPTHVQRSSYGQINHIPYEAMTLHEMRNIFNGAGSTSSIKSIVDMYNPMGFFFAHVEDRLKNQTGMDVAYTCGGLCDVMNIWQVPIVPGMKLYIILMVVDGINKIVPYASLSHPFHDPNLAKHIDSTRRDMAWIDIGTVCVASNQPPIMSAPATYVHEPGSFKPLSGTHTISDTTDPTKVLHNILRVNVDMLRWEYFA